MRVDLLLEWIDLTPDDANLLLILILARHSAGKTADAALGIHIEPKLLLHILAFLCPGNVSELIVDRHTWRPGLVCTHVGRGIVHEVLTVES